MNKAYRIPNEEELKERGFGDHWAYTGRVLVGPNDFEVALGAPEDCSFYRDGADLVDELNRLHDEVEHWKAKA